MNYEYRRPEIEQSLMNATSLEGLEVGLKAVWDLMPDLVNPEVYGHKLFAPGLDAAVPLLARRLGLPDVPLAKSNDNVCIVATQFYLHGGHSRVAFDISELLGEDRVTTLATDCYGRLRHRELVGLRAQPSPLKRRSDLLLGARSLGEKIIECYNLLAAVRPSRVFMLTHHFDMVAAVSLWPFRNVVEFLHHADHVPSVGATLPWSAHVDVTWRCHSVCRSEGLAPVYAGLLGRPGGPTRNPPRQTGAFLRIATCGPPAKYEGAASHRWADYAIAALSIGAAELVHIGPDDPGLRETVLQALNGAGIDPRRYVFTGSTDDLSAELIARQADVYLASYPVSGAKASLEAMTLGLPTIIPVDEASAPLLQFDFPAPTWTPVRSPDEMRRALEELRGRPPGADPGSMAEIDAELTRFRRYVLGEAEPAAAPPQDRAAAAT